MTLYQKHKLETTFRNLLIFCDSYQELRDLYVMGKSDTSLRDNYKNQINSALDTLSQIDITEPQPYTEEILDLTNQIKDETNN